MSKACTRTKYLSAQQTHETSFCRAMRRPQRVAGIARHQRQAAAARRSKPWHEELLLSAAEYALRFPSAAALPSNGAVRGLVAMQRFAAGSLVCVYPVRVVRVTPWSNTPYTVNLADVGYRVSRPQKSSKRTALRFSQHSFCGVPCLPQSFRAVNGLAPGGPYCNEASRSRANAHLECLPATVRLRQVVVLLVRATRAIAPGEQVTLWYGPTYVWWRSHVGYSI